MTDLREELLQIIDAIRKDARRLAPTDAGHGMLRRRADELERALAAQPAPAEPAYARHIVADMLRSPISYDSEAMRAQADLLDAADNASAMGVRTVSRPAPAELTDAETDRIAAEVELAVGACATWDEVSPTELVRAMHRAMRAAPAAAAVPEARPDLDPAELNAQGASAGDHEIGYNQGWNDCRDAMLSAAPQPDHSPGKMVTEALGTAPATCNGRRCGWCEDGAVPCKYTAAQRQQRDDELLELKKDEAQAGADDFRSREHSFPIGLKLGAASKFLTVHNRIGQPVGWGWEAEFSQGRGYGFGSRADAVLAAVRKAYRLAQPKPSDGREDGVRECSWPDCRNVCGVPKPLECKARQPATCTQDVQVQGEAKAGADDDAVCPSCERLTAIRHCQACGCDFAQPKPAEGGAVVAYQWEERERNGEWETEIGKLAPKSYGEGEWVRNVRPLVYGDVAPAGSGEAVYGIDSPNFNPVAWFDTFNAHLYTSRAEAQKAHDAGNPILPVESVSGSGEAVEYQYRELSGSTWRYCDRATYEATIKTGSYGGHEQGPKCEVRALYAGPAADAELLVRAVWEALDKQACPPHWMQLACDTITRRLAGDGGA